MIRLMRLLPAVLAALLLAGCANFSKQAYSPSPADPIRHILIATPAEFPKVRLGMEGRPAMMLGAFGAIGAVGAVLASANGEGNQETLDQALRSQGDGYQKQLLSTLDASFGAAGIRTQTVAVPRESRFGLLEDYKSLAGQKNVDAVLDIFVFEASYGGTHPILDSEDRPIIRLRARLVSTKTLQVLYADDIFFGYTNPFMSAQEIKSPKQFYFPNVEALHKDKARAAEGMRVAATEVARFLVNQLTVLQEKSVSR
jgi:hypothetical protein